ncbi:hypothetical protein [Nocardia sp. NPDC051570]|uniref:hypothetical protein n=1 Tax=Nocardia sp. NPDC051570 TaxID=3364324 RepID=UPI0037B81435
MVFGADGRGSRRPWRRMGWVRLVLGVLVAVGLVIAALVLLGQPEQGNRPAFDPVVPLPAVMTPVVITTSGVPSPL